MLLWLPEDKNGGAEERKLEERKREKATTLDMIQTKTACDRDTGEVGENCYVGLFVSQLMQCNRVSPTDVRTVRANSAVSGEANRENENQRENSGRAGHLATPRPAAMERWAESGGDKPMGERGMMQAPGKLRDSLIWGSHQPTSQESPHTPRDFSVLLMSPPNMWITSWNGLPSLRHNKADWMSGFFSQRPTPFFPEVQDKVSKMWHSYSSHAHISGSSLLSSVDGADLWGYAKLSPPGRTSSLALVLIVCTALFLLTPKPCSQPEPSVQPKDSWPLSHVLPKRQGPKTLIPWMSTEFNDRGAPMGQVCRPKNAAARLVFNKPKRAHITPLFISLHWLPLAARIKFKALTLAYRSITGSASSYFHSLLRVYIPTRSLRSVMLTIPCWWNALPTLIRNAESLTTFKRQLKTHLFREHLTS
ncbi:unnamed protein product [Leuciscus chuanchicus]